MSGLDPIIHAPARLQLCGLLARVNDADFAFLRDSIRVSDSVLSKHTKALEDAGYVRVSKKVVRSRQRTWLALTPEGRRAFHSHVTELQRLASLAVDEPTANVKS